jgi:outer membrane cobalamin receptor
VVFTDDAGHHVTENTNSEGRAAAPSTFTPASADVSAEGYENRHVTSVAGVTTVRLQLRERLIGSVRVATGSRESLHRLPFAASVLNADAVAASAATSSDALLRDLPGFDRTRSNSAFTNYGQLRVSLSGAGNDRAVALLDGFPAQDGFGGQVDWAAIPVHEIDRVELLRGAGSALYGSGAIGGVLDIRTVTPPWGDTPPRGGLRIGGGSGGSVEQNAWIAAGTDRTGVRAAVTSSRNSYFALPPGFSSRADHISTSSARTIAFELRTGTPEKMWQAGLRDAGDDQDEGRSNYTQSRSVAQYDLRFAGSHLDSSYNAGFYSRQAVVDNIADRFPAAPGVLRYRQHVPSAETGADASWTRSKSNADFTIRTDLRSVHGVSDQYGPGGVLQSSGSGVQRLAGLAVQSVFHGPRYELVAGARADTVTFSDGRLNGTGVPTRNNRAVSPRVALRLDLSRSFALRASAAGAFRAPYLNELVRGYAIGAVQYQPNAALAPERSRSLSGGFDWATGRQRLTYDIVRTDVNDAITFVTLDPTHQQRANVARTRSVAQTLTYTRDLGACGSIAMSASANDARIVAGPPADTGKQLAYVPKYSANARALWTSGRTRGSIGVSYLGAAYADDLNTQFLPAAIVADATLEHQLSARSELWVALDNLTGARYLSSNDRYGPPASLRIGITVPFGSPGRAQVSGSCRASAPIR